MGALSVPDRHQLKIARDTLRMPDTMVGIMGGPDKREARRIIRRLTGRPPSELHRHYGHPLEHEGHEHEHEGPHVHRAAGLGDSKDELYY